MCKKFFVRIFFLLQLYKIEFQPRIFQPTWYIHRVSSACHQFCPGVKRKTSVPSHIKLYILVLLLCSSSVISYVKIYNAILIKSSKKRLWRIYQELHQNPCSSNNGTKNFFKQQKLLVPSTRPTCMIKHDNNIPYFHLKYGCFTIFSYSQL